MYKEPRKNVEYQIPVKSYSQEGVPEGMVSLDVTSRKYPFRNRMVVKLETYKLMVKEGRAK